MPPPADWRSARATLAIAAATALAWIVVAFLRMDEFAAVWGGFIPSRIDGMVGDGSLAPVWLTPLTATFVHAGIIHLAFNLLILLFCGRAVENVLGPGGLIALYVAGAYFAAGAHYLVNVEEALPMVGASGAISAVLGAYALLFGRNRVRIANRRLALWLHALWLGVAWIVLQVLVGFTFELSGASLAIAAHIGGFLIGLLLARPLLLFRYRNA
jgi:membrane associated rhomboid family serine protease